MNKKAVQQLCRELPKLVELGVLDLENAERLRAHLAAAAEAQRPGRLAVAIFASLGAVLVGAGIILLLAHNWDDLARPVRAALSFAPLVLAQALAFWVLARRAGSLAWREGAGAFLFLAVGASISLVAQTYHISGSFAAFILTWSLLGLAAVYFLSALVPALFYLWAITHWACHVRWESGFAAGYWLLLALLAPFGVAMYRCDARQPRLAALLWAACASVAVAAGVTVEGVLPGLWIVVYSGLFAFMFLASDFMPREAEGFWPRPLRHFGAGGVLVTAFVLTFERTWRRVRWDDRWWEKVEDNPLLSLPDFALGLILPVAAIVLWATMWRRKRTAETILGAVLPLAILGYGLASRVYGADMMAVALFNLYLFAVGMWLLVGGIRAGRQGRMNLGLSVVSALIVARFFDSEIGFVLRGLAFIGLGAAFLAANVVISRRIARSGAPRGAVERSVQ